MKENENGTFYSTEEIKPIYPEIVPVYQSAFAGEPWFEVSKCEDTEAIRRCIGGFSKLPIGEFCRDCGNCLTRSAYESEELISSFERIAGMIPTAWYTEGNDQGLNLAAFVWKADANFIADEKYPDVPEMKSWLSDTLGANPIMWLDEIFSDRTKKSTGNLVNFAQMVEGFKGELGPEALAFRTINKRLIYGAVKKFPSAVVYENDKDVPDRRSVVVIRLPEPEKFVRGCGFW